MFKALVKRVINGDQRYEPHPGEENLHFSSIEEAVNHLITNHVPMNYGHGMVTTPEGELVVAL